MVKRHTGGNVQLGAAVEQTKRAFLKATSEETSQKSLRGVDGVTRLVNLVTAAEVEVRAAGVASLADGDITGDGRDTVGHRGSTELGTAEGAKGEGEDGGDGELHFD